MADGGDEAAAGSRPDSGASSPEQHLEEYQHLIELGLDTRVAGKLEEIYRTGKLVHSELDDRALDALKEFPCDGAQSVLQQFLESNLEHVSNKSAFLCGIMKTYRQKLRALGSAAAGASGSSSVVAVTTGDTSLDLKPVGKGPDEEKIKEILERTGYTLDVTTGQRKYGGPPPNWTDPPPSNGCEIFCGKIPRDVYEDELIPLFEKCGTIWDLRLMMDPLTNLNRGYAFVTFTTPDAAHEAVRQLNGSEIRKGRKVGVTISHNNHRLFVGNIPKNRDGPQLYQDFVKYAPGLAEVIIYSSPDDRRKNRGFCFLEYDSHKSASLAKRRLSTGRVKIFGCDIIVDWADPQDEPDNDTMSKVKVLYVRNLTQDFTEERLKESFEVHGPIQRVKKIKDYAFVHFEERDDAVAAMDALQGRVLHGATLEISLAKPPSDRKKKEEILKARERRLLQQHVVTRGGPGGPLAVIPHPPVVPGGFRPGAGSRPVNLRGPAQGGPASGPVSFGRDFDYEYSFGPYRGGYPDPYFNGGYYPYAGSDYYYDYPTRGGRGGRPGVPALRRGGQRGRPGGRSGAAVQDLMASTGAVPRWRGSDGSPMLPRGGGHPHRGAGGGGWRGRPASAKPSGRGSATAGPTAPRTGWEEPSSEEAPRDPVSVGTWRPDGTPSGAAPPAASSTAAAAAAPSGSDESVWYQDSYGTQWS